MSGPEHYRTAEKIAASVEDGSTGGTRDQVNAMIALAQVHATLALAAATVDVVYIAGDRREYNPTTETEEAWKTATA